MTKRNYLYVAVAVAALFILCHFLNIGVVTAFGSQTATYITNPYIAAAAIVLSLVLLKAKFYVWIMLVCAIAVAYLESRYISSGVGNTMILATKAAAFLCFSYIINFVRVLFFK